MELNQVLLFVRAVLERKIHNHFKEPEHRVFLECAAQQFFVFKGTSKAATVGNVLNDLNNLLQPMQPASKVAEWESAVATSIQVATKTWCTGK